MSDFRKVPLIFREGLKDTMKHCTMCQVELFCIKCYLSYICIKLYLRTNNFFVAGSLVHRSLPLRSFADFADKGCHSAR